MGQRGPKPLPTNVHRLKGNPSKLPAERLVDEVQPEVAVPTPPKHLSREARAEWRRLSGELYSLGLISKIDCSAFAAYCQAYGRWVQAETKIASLGDDGFVESTPSGYKQMSVWLQISNRAVDQMKSFIAEFGMTPSARSRVTTSQRGQSEDRTTGGGPKRFFT